MKNIKRVSICALPCLVVSTFSMADLLPLFNAPNTSFISIGYTSSNKEYTNNGAVILSGGDINSDSNGRRFQLYDNTITFSNSQFQGYVIGVYSTNTAGVDVKENTFTINGSELKSYVTGARTNYGNAFGNNLNIGADTTVKGLVNGGHAVRGDANDNRVTIDGGNFGSAVYGGRSGVGSADDQRDGDANFNIVTINDGTFASNIIAGIREYGNASSGDTNNNKVYMNGGSITGDILGGYNTSSNSPRGDANENKVNITAGEMRDVIGGRTNAKEGNANDNKVSLDSSDDETIKIITRNVEGGRTANGAADKNIVTISGANTSVGGNVIGGWSNLDSTNNQININNAIVGSGNNSVVAGLSQNGAVTGNTIEMNGGTVNAYMVGGRSTGASGNATYNKVIINGGNDGRVTSYVYGGWANGTNGVSGNATNNEVHIKEATVNGNVSGGRALSGDASNNFVYINQDPMSTNRSTINAVQGGFANTVGNADSNTVRITNTDVNTTIHGGYSNQGGASGNKVILNDVKATPINSQGNVYGASKSTSNDDTVADMSTNLVDISNSKIGNYVAGAHANQGSYAKMVGNVVNIVDSFIGLNGFGEGVFGATSRRGMNIEANYNIVTIEDSEIIGSIYGGRAVENNSYGNQVFIQKGTDPEAEGTKLLGANSTNGLTNGSVAAGTFNLRTEYEGDNPRSRVNYDMSGRNGLDTLQLHSNEVVINSNSTNGSDIRYNVYGFSGALRFENSDAYTFNIHTVNNNIFDIHKNRVTLKNAYTNQTMGANMAISKGEAVAGNSNNSYTVNANTFNITDNGVWATDSQTGSVYGGRGYITFGSDQADNANAYNATGNNFLINNNGVKLVNTNAVGNVTGGYGSITSPDATAGNSYEITDNKYSIQKNGIFISGGSAGNVHGGYAVVTAGANGDGYNVTKNVFDVNQNEVLIQDGANVGYVYGGYGYKAASADSSNTLTANNNIVQIGQTEQITREGGLNTITGSVYGGFSNNGETSGNAVIINNAEVGVDGVSGGNVYGGYAAANGTGNASNANSNIVQIGNNTTINSGNNAGNVFGGSSQNGNADSNTVTIKGDNISIASQVYGGHSRNGNADSNTVIITGNDIKIAERVYAGYSNNKQTVKNKVFIDNAKAGSMVAGGYVNSGDGAASDNTVQFTGTASANQVIGGYTASGNTHDNLVILADSADITDSVYGGYVNSGIGTAINNIVSISGNASAQNVYGARTALGDANENVVVLEDSAVIRGNVYGGSSEGGSADANIITLIDSAEVTDSVFGGFVMSGNGSASRNQITMTGNAAAGSIMAGQAADGDVADNIVSLADNAKVIGDLTAGYASGDGNVSGNTINLYNTASVVDMTGGSSAGSGEVYNNVINLFDNASVSGQIYLGSSGSGAVRDNTFNIHGTDINLAGATLYGSNQTGWAGQNNVINVDNWTGDVAGVHNFSKYTFTMPEGTTANSTIFNVTGSAPTDVTGAEADITYIGGGGVPLNPGEHISLINNATGASATNAINNVNHGAFFIYDFDILTENDQWVAKVRETKGNPNSDVINEGRAAGMAFLIQKADFLANNGMNNIREAYLPGQSLTLQPFMVGGGGRLRYNTGSHVDIDGYSTIMGLSLGSHDVDKGGFTLGAFYEHGRGNYSSHSKVNGLAVDGEGETQYDGGGILARYDSPEKDYYIESAFSMGRNKVEFESQDIVKNMMTKYKSDATYFSGHVGATYVYNLDNVKLEFTGKYLGLHQKSDTINIEGMPLKFKDVTSNRLQAGVTSTFEVEKGIYPYVGLTYEHEFSNRSKAMVYQTKLKTVDLEGGTGIGALGLVLKPQTGPDIYFNLGVQGYTGKREGVTGNFRVDITF